MGNIFYFLACCLTLMMLLNCLMITFSTASGSNKVIYSAAVTKQKRERLLFYHQIENTANRRRQLLLQQQSTATTNKDINNNNNKSKESSISLSVIGGLSNYSPHNELDYLSNNNDSFYLNTNDNSKQQLQHQQQQQHQINYHHFTGVYTNNLNSNFSYLAVSAPTVAEEIDEADDGSMTMFCTRNVGKCIFLSFIFGGLIICTVVGNSFVIAAVVLERNLHNNVANYLIVSLASADLTVAIMVMPIGAYQEVSKFWSLGKLICDIWTSFDVLCCTASILHLVAIAFDRYKAITNVDYGAKRTIKRILSTIICIWSISLTMAVSPHIFGLSYQETQKNCHLTDNLTYQLVSTLAAFYLPLFVMCVIYWNIFQSAKFRIRRRAFDSSHTVHSNNSSLITRPTASAAQTATTAKAATNTTVEVTNTTTTTKILNTQNQHQQSPPITKEIISADIGGGVELVNENNKFSLISINHHQQELPTTTVASNLLLSSCSPSKRSVVSQQSEKNKKKFFSKQNTMTSEEIMEMGEGDNEKDTDNEKYGDEESSSHKKATNKSKTIERGSSGGGEKIRSLLIRNSFLLRNLSSLQSRSRKSAADVQTGAAYFSMSKNNDENNETVDEIVVDNKHDSNGSIQFIAKSTNITRNASYFGGQGQQTQQEIVLPLERQDKNNNNLDVNSGVGVIRKGVSWSYLLGRMSIVKFRSSNENSNITDAISPSHHSASPNTKIETIKLRFKKTNNQDDEETVEKKKKTKKSSSGGDENKKSSYHSSSATTSPSFSGSMSVSRSSSQHSTYSAQQRKSIDHESLLKQNQHQQQSDDISKQLSMPEQLQQSSMKPRISFAEHNSTILFEQQKSSSKLHKADSISSVKMNDQSLSLTAIQQQNQSYTTPSDEKSFGDKQRSSAASCEIDNLNSKTSVLAEQSNLQQQQQSFSLPNSLKRHGSVVMMGSNKGNTVSDRINNDEPTTKINSMPPTLPTEASSKLKVVSLANMQKKRAKIDMKRERKAAKTLGVIMSCFIVCWLPFFLMQIFFSVCKDCALTGILINSPLVTILTWSGYLNSLLNPVIYTIFNPDFRNAFKKILFRQFNNSNAHHHRHHRHHRNNHNNNFNNNNSNNKRTNL